MLCLKILNLDYRHTDLLLSQLMLALETTCFRHVGVMIFSVIFMVTIGVYPEPIIQFVEMITPSMTAVMP